MTTTPATPSPVIDAQRDHAWAYLNRVVEGPSRPLQQLLAAGYSPEEIARGVRTQASWIGELAHQTASHYEWDRADEDLAAAAEVGARLITPDSDEWPHEQFDQAFATRDIDDNPHLASYRQDSVPPHVLWVKGKPLNEMVAQSVAVVGSRAATRYGLETTRMIANGLGSRLWTVVTGGALGVETTALESALAAGGNGVAVAACGIDRTYPARNTSLLERVAANGCVVSEYAPGIPPQRHRFLTRSRLVAALTAGTVVVEAAWRSGALTTLSWAETLGRVPMAVPGPVTSNGSLGCHDRIKEGRAQLVTDAHDIRALLDSPEAGHVNGRGVPEQTFTRNELQVYDAVDDTAAPAKTIAARAGLPVQLTTRVLMDLTYDGLVKKEGVTWRKATTA